MRGIVTALWVFFWLAVAGLAGWLLGIGDLVRASFASGHMMDWVMGGLCLLWLLVILKAPWDLYFDAARVVFEIERSKERQVAVLPAREEYVRQLQRRLLWLSLAAHLGSALLVAGIAWFSGRAVGYYFAVFYLVSTVLRPAVAGYVYLTHKLQAIGEETCCAPEDVVEMRGRLDWQHSTIGRLEKEVEQSRKQIKREGEARAAETRDLRQRLHAVSRELETTGLTDNQEVITGIQAFVRLITQSGRSEAS